MRNATSPILLCITAIVATLVSACGGAGGAGTGGARVSANAQSISYGPAPTLPLYGSASVTATASSGLTVVFRSTTPTICTVEANSGLVSAIAPGTCVVAANQSGNSTWAPAPETALSIPVVFDPNQTIAFDVAPALTLGGTATFSATATSRLAVTFSSLTPAVCTVNATSGLVTDLTVGDCTIAAIQAGDVFFNAAPQVTQTINVPMPAGTSAPGAPTGVNATLGSNANTVIVSVASVDSGGSPITGYTVVSSPTGIAVTAANAPVTVDCGGSCAGHSFAVYATNAVGNGSASSAAEVITQFDVKTFWREPDCGVRDSIFVGSFTLNSTTGAITGLAGRLSESMTGTNVAYPNDNMTWLQLSNQLQTWHDADLGGTFAATFKNATTATFYSGTWRPEDGVAVNGTYAGYISPFNPGINANNAYALIFVPDDPFAALSSGQIAMLAYADCAPGGMMGATCMTGTSASGYGRIGTMSGYPVSQTITRH